MVAPAKAPPSPLAEAKKNTGTVRPSSHALHLTRKVKSETDGAAGREGGASWQESGFYMATWKDGREGGRGSDTRPYRLAIRQLRRVM